jgi:hypothetical protein
VYLLPHFPAILADLQDLAPCSFFAVGRLVPGSIFGIVWVKMKEVASQTCIFRLNLIMLNTVQLTYVLILAPLLFLPGHLYCCHLPAFDVEIAE